MNYNEDIRYLRFATLLARKSRDPSTQNGAIIVKNKEIIGKGVNNFPLGVREDLKIRWERPTKYSFIEHAERNAIYYSARYGHSTEGGVLYCPWFACADCARAIIQAGIERCVGLENDTNLTNQRWLDSILIGNEMLSEAGVQYYNITLTKKFGIKLLRDGKEIEV